VTDSLFRDVREIERADDSLHREYTARQIIERVWREHLQPRRKQLLIAVVAMMVGALTTGVIPPIIKLAIDDIFVKKNMSIVYALSFGTFLITLLKTGSEYISKVTLGYLGSRFISDLRIKMFERLAFADMQWLEGTHSGLFLSGFLNDTNFIRDTASRVIVAMGENLIKSIALAIAMIWLDPLMSAIILVALPVAVMSINRQRRTVKTSTKQTMQETGDVSRLITQTLRGLRVVRAYGQEQHEIDRARNVINRALEFSMRGLRAKSASGPAVELLSGIGFSLAILVASLEGVSGRMTIGEFSAFMASAMLLYQPLKQLAQLQTSLEEGVAAASRVFGIIDQQQQMYEVPGAGDLALTEGSIHFEQVSFAYEPGQPVLQDFSLEVPAGKTVALVGPSGSGKSTLLNLTLRFFDPQHGRILIDGTDIAKVKLASLRSHIALVTQDPVLFDESLAANIAYGSPGASRERIADAARAAAAHDFISRLPEGYDAPAGEAGNNLSGGERQRIAIARALMRNAPILLLDEPTSALDSQSEEKVQNALSNLMQGRTVLMIAHRLSTVKDADLICVLDRGRIVEKGTHAELVARSGLYSELYRTQFEARALDGAEVGVAADRAG
jgi:subfamily B ATP-binding cassette protein MsbA